MKTSDKPIIVEERFNSSIESVWKALTEIDEMRRWYFDNIPAFKPETGFKTEFNVRSEERNFLHKWIVTEAEYLKKIKYRWEFESYQGKSTADFELFRQDDSTLLRLTVVIEEDFQEDIPEFERDSCIAGWNYFINGRLKDYLNSKKNL
jgi:uncharacterized protein YndB with AHSA1/START domain